MEMVFNKQIEIMTEYPILNSTQAEEYIIRIKGMKKRAKASNESVSTTFIFAVQIFWEERANTIIAARPYGSPAKACKSLRSTLRSTADGGNLEAG
jgi:hypothetical protein